MAAPARTMARKLKPKRPARLRRPRIEYVFVDTSEGPEDIEAARAIVSDWLDTLPQE